MADSRAGPSVLFRLESGNASGDEVPKGELSVPANDTPLEVLLAFTGQRS